MFWEFELISPHLMGFRPRMRASDNCLVLKTLIDKQFKENERLYSCFVDFSEAFDTVWRRKGLLAKIESYGINGNIFNVLRSLYSNTTTHDMPGFYLLGGGGEASPQTSQLPPPKKKFY